jgi:hypothetical protein
MDATNSVQGNKGPARELQRKKRKLPYPLETLAVFAVAAWIVAIAVGALGYKAVTAAYERLPAAAAFIEREVLQWNRGPR